MGVSPPDSPHDNSTRGSQANNGIILLHSLSLELLIQASGTGETIVGLDKSADS